MMFFATIPYRLMLFRFSLLTDFAAAAMMLPLSPYAFIAILFSMPMMPPFFRYAIDAMLLFRLYHCFTLLIHMMLSFSPYFSLSSHCRFR